VNFYAICFIPCALFVGHNIKTFIVFSDKGVFFFLAHPYARFTPPSYALTIFIGGGENLLRAPNCFTHSVKKVKIKVI